MASSTRLSRTPSSRTRSTMRSRTRPDARPPCDAAPFVFEAGPRCISVAIEPAADTFELSGVGEVDLQRRDRNVTFRRRVEVGTGASLARSADGADPVDRFAARIARPHDRLRRMALAEARRDDAPDLRRGAVRDIHVQQKGSGQGLLYIAAHHLR